MRKLHKGHIVGSVALMMLLFVGCGTEKEVAPETVKQVTVNNSNPLTTKQSVQVTQGDVVQRELYDGVVTPYIEELYFVEDGTFLEYCVALGDVVEEGDIIARTDTEELQKQVDSLQEQIDNLTSQYEYSMQTLQNREAILQYEMDINYYYLSLEDYMTPTYSRLCKELGRQDWNLKANRLEQKQQKEEYELKLPYLQKQLKEKKKQLKSNVIKAPFAGSIVQLRQIAGGEKVSETIPYVAIADTTRTLVVGDYVASGVINKAKELYIFINGKNYAATYLPMDKELYSKLSAAGQTTYTSYEIENDGSFEYGQAAKVVVVKETAKDVLVLPMFAVRQESTRRYCYVNKDGEREKVYIQTGLNDGMYYEIESGLEKGDEVYIE